MEQIQLPQIGFQDEYTIKAYDIDPNKCASPLALSKLMHETAMQNVIKLKISVWDLESLHLTWVLMRQYLHIHRLPKLGEKIKIATYPAGFRKVMTFRDYKVLDEQSRLLLHSSSTWLLMDIKERSMTTIPDFILRLKKDIPTPDNCLPRSDFKLPRIKNTLASNTYKVGWFDLDFNGHANNIPYLRWMLEPLENYLESKQLAHLEVQYKAECYWKEEVTAKIEQLETNLFLHELIHSASGNLLAQARTKWTSMH